jgi:hypothetical protein
MVTNACDANCRMAQRLRYQPTARPESLAAMGPNGRLELPCQPYQSCGSPSILAGNNYGADGDARNPNLSLTKRAFFLLNYIGK